jgi:hypothetical protein
MDWPSEIYWEFNNQGLVQTWVIIAKLNVDIWWVDPRLVNMSEGEGPGGDAVEDIQLSLKNKK